MFLSAASLATLSHKISTAEITIPDWAVRLGDQSANMFEEMEITLRQIWVRHVPLDSWVYPALSPRRFGLHPLRISGHAPVDAI
jgi:hypothetical protein